MSALKTLLDLVHTDDPFRNAPDNLLEVQLEAAQERFAQRRKQIKVLDQRATDRGVERIGRLEDIVHILFSDATYKSYPESFLENGRWDRMTQWFQSLSTDRLDGVDLAGVQTVDDWFDALQSAGAHVNSSSGTSGKNSFISMNEADMDVSGHLIVQAARWTSDVLRQAPPQDCAVFVMGPSAGSYSGVGRVKRCAELLARPGDVHFLSDVAPRAQDSVDVARLNRSIAAGTARPTELDILQRRFADQAIAVQADMQIFFDKLLARKDEPIVLMGLSTMLWEIMKIAQARGMTSMKFHPRTYVATGGGRKNVDVPADYIAQMQQFFGLGPQNYGNPYGMSEMSGCCPMIPGKLEFVIPPWIIPILLEATNETLLNPAGTTGQVTGRFAFLDLLVDGRWGAVVSGDKVTIDFSSAEDGIKVPVLRKVDRYKDLPGDDKATCAGTIDAYIRGIVEPA